MLRKFLVVALTLLCTWSVVCRTANAQGVESQTFDSEAAATAAGWSGTDNRDVDLGTDFGFSNTNNAGGSAGEAGGLFPRIQFPVASYGDTTIGGTLTLDDALVATGKLIFSNFDFDGEVFLGWYDSTDLPDRHDFMGFHLREPNGATAPDFRGLASYNLAGGTIDVGDFVAVPTDTQLEFQIEYDPSRTRFGELTVTLFDRAGGQDFTISNGLTSADRQEGAEFNAFGLTTSGGAGSNDPPRQVELYIDDLQYTIKGIPPIKGDFDGDGKLEAADIDALTAHIAGAGTDMRFDLNGDGKIDQEDRRVWVKDPTVANTWFGDANLDNEFNSGDFVQVFQNGEYEDAAAKNSTWAEGDWNGDLEFDSGDFVTAFQDGGFERGPRAAVASVPEPAAGILLLMAFVAGGLMRSRR